MIALKFLSNYLKKFEHSIPPKIVKVAWFCLASMSWESSSRIPWAMLHIRNLIYDTYSMHQKVGLSGIWTHDHWIPFRRSNQMSYQAMSSTRTQSQFFTATAISLCVQCQISFRLMPLSATLQLTLVKIYISILF